MSSLQRLRSERAFHDRQALNRAADLGAASALLFTDDDWLDHETWIRPAFSCLGELAGEPALDFGCGHGMAAIVMARRGGVVTALDLSIGYLTETQRRAVANGVTVQCVQADGERLPFADASFSRIWGNAILHHLDLTVTAAELWRVLRPGGVAVFCEPRGDNPVLRLARRRIPYAGKERTIDEEPLRLRELKPLHALFPGLRIESYQLFSMIRRVCTRSKWLGGLDRIDRVLLKSIPVLGRLCRYMVISLRKPA